MEEFIFDESDPITEKLKTWMTELMLGDMAGASNDFRTAIVHLTNAIKISEDERFENLINSASPIQIMDRNKLSKPYFLRANAHESLEQYNQALADYNKALVVDPMREDILLYRGMLKGQMKNFNDAITDFDIILSRNPNNQEALKFRGLGKYEINDKFNAKKDLEKAKNLGLKEAHLLLKKLFPEQ